MGREMLPVANGMLRVAEELLAYCTKCRLDLMHVIVSMDRGVIVKSQCKSCNGVHTFRSPRNRENVSQGGKVRPARKNPAAPLKRSASPARPAVDVNRWPELIAGRVGEKSREYRMQEFFGEGELVLHPTFGEGVVASVPGPQKIEVHFEAGVKLLAHGR